MKIKLLRASNTVKEIEFAANLPPLEIQRLAVDLMFENFERNQTHLWPREEDIRGSRHEIQVMSDADSWRASQARHRCRANHRCEVYGAGKATAVPRVEDVPS